MNCRGCERRVWDYYENRLSEAERASVETHLQSCPTCQRHYESARQTYSALRALPRAQAPAGLVQRVHARIEQLPEPKPLARWWHAWRRIALAPALGLTVALLWWGVGQIQSGSVQTARTPDALAQQYAEDCVNIHEQLEAVDWAPSPSGYLLTTNYTR
ncbi:MAG: zf-HC2 domain-containing protein [Fimbriimonadales bacterium]